MVDFFANQLFCEPWENTLLKAEWLPWSRSIVERSSSFATSSLAELCNNMAMVYKDLGRLEQALEFAEKSITIQEKILEPDHPSLATSYNNMAMVYQDLGERRRG